MKRRQLTITQHVGQWRRWGGPSMCRPGRVLGSGNICRAVGRSGFIAR